MTTPQDCSIGFAVESTYRTYTAPTRWLEFTNESLGFDKDVKQGKGMRVSSRVARSGRRVVPTAQGKGDVEFEVCSKGLGLLWQAAFGSATSTLVSGSTYQQLYNLGDTPNSLTVQKGIPQAGGTVDPYSYLGCMVDSFEIDSPNGEIVTAKVSLDVGDLTTAQSYVAPSYTAGTVNLFHWGQGTVSLGGTLTAPTSTTTASIAGATTVNVRSFNVQVNNNLNGKRMNYGNSGRKSKPVVGGLREIKGKFVAEYDQTTLRDAYLADTPMPLVITFTGAALSTGNETFQIVLPEIKLDGDVPGENDGDLVTIEHSFTVLDNLTAAQPIWALARTSDSAL